MHYSAVDLRREDIWGCNKLLRYSRNSGNLASRILVSYVFSEEFHRLMLHFRIFVTEFWKTWFTCLFIVGIIILTGHLDCLPWYNINVRVLERLLPVITILRQCPFQ